MPPLDRLLWLFPAAFAIHVAEEAPGFTRWVREHARSDYAPRDFARNNVAGAVLSAGAAFAITRCPRRAPLALYTVALTQQAVGNAAFHARTGAPGSRTAIGLVLPLWALITRAALREGLLTPRRVAGSMAAGGVLHALAVRRQIYGR